MEGSYSTSSPFPKSATVSNVTESWLCSKQALEYLNIATKRLEVVPISDIQGTFVHNTWDNSQ